jgi:hypothetical protein
MMILVGELEGADLVNLRMQIEKVLAFYASSDILEDSRLWEIFLLFYFSK